MYEAINHSTAHKIQSHKKTKRTQKASLATGANTSLNDKTSNDLEDFKNALAEIQPNEKTKIKPDIITKKFDWIPKKLAIKGEKTVNNANKVIQIIQNIFVESTNTDFTFFSSSKFLENSLFKNKSNHIVTTDKILKMLIKLLKIQNSSILINLSIIGW